MSEHDLLALARTPVVRTIVAAFDSSRSKGAVPLYLVGGVVRDLLANNAAGDIDMAVAGPISQRCEELKRAGLRVIETGLQHGTVTVLVEERAVEITSFRRAGRDGGDEGKDITQDLAARDFSINALAFDLRAERIIDNHGGKEDLRAGVLRAVGEPSDRMNEDPLRVLRAIRFGPAAGRNLEAKLAKVLLEFAPQLHSVAIERIRSEFEKILVSSHARAAMESMLNNGIFSAILPEVLVTVGFEQNDFHTEDVFQHTLSVLERARADKILRLTAFFHDIGKAHTLSVSPDGARHFYQHEIISAEIAQTVMERLKFSSRDVRDVQTLVRLHMRPFEVGPAGLRRLMRDLGELFSLWREFKIADSPPVMAADEFSQRLAAFDAMVEQELERQKGDPFGRLAVDGEDLKQLGFSEGRRLGDALKALREVVLEDPELNRREELLARARKML